MHGQNSSYTQFMYPKLPITDQQQPNTLDPARLEAFRKNWEYYKMWNPQVYRNNGRVSVRGILLILLANASLGYNQFKTNFRNKKIYVYQTR